MSVAVSALAPPRLRVTPPYRTGSQHTKQADSSCPDVLHSDDCGHETPVSMKVQRYGGNDSAVLCCSPGMS